MFTIFIFLLGMFAGVALSAYTTTDEKFYEINEKRKAKKVQEMVAAVEASKQKANENV